MFLKVLTQNYHIITSSHFAMTKTGDIAKSNSRDEKEMLAIKGETSKTNSKGCG